MTKGDYIHGYSEAEQDRLIMQARYWEHVILDGMCFEPGQRVLEIGCGAGGVIGVIGQAFPGLHLAGIDISSQQLAYACVFLRSVGLSDVDLRQGDGADLPWKDGSQDHVVIVWVLEHLKEPLPVLREARRVLRPGGAISCIETDYTSIQVSPSNSVYDYFLGSFVEYFNRNGDAEVGPKLESLLVQAGFSDVDNRCIELEYSDQPGCGDRIAHIDYMAEFIQPVLPDLLESADDPAMLAAGFEYFQAMKTLAQGRLDHRIYRATGRA